MELAPLLGLAPRIVDLVSTGRTLKENGLVERETILEVTSRLVVNRAAFKTMPEVARLVDAFRSLSAKAAA
jgi:ATP phosphoribosyltransferase